MSTQPFIKPPPKQDDGKDNTGCWIAGLLGCGCLFVLLVSALLTGILYFALNKPVSEMQADAARPHSPVLQAELDAIEMPAGFWQRPETLKATETRNNTEVAAVKAMVKELFLEGKFDLLDDLAQTYRTSDKRTYSGDFKLDIFYTALYELQDEGMDYNKLYNELTRWYVKDTGNITPYVGVMRQSYKNAWAWRGDGYEVSPENKRNFVRGLEFAQKHIDEARDRKVTHHDPAFYGDAIKVAMGLNHPYSKVRALVQKSREVDAAYFPSYSAFAICMLPRWQGEKESDVVHFANEAAEWSKNEAGESAYAWVAYTIATYGKPNMQTFYKQYPFEWARVQQGFADWDREYPSTRKMMNGFLWLAVAAGDTKTARGLFNTIGDEYDESVWKERKTYDEYRRRIVGP